MFTGIVQSVGAITQVVPLAAGKRVTVHAGGLALDDVGLGDSIAINGACMTVIAQTQDTFTVDISAESLHKTVGLDIQGTPVNLEKALRVGDALGGHWVSGHIDGTGVVQRVEAVGESQKVVVRAPPEISKYLVYKGSIAVQGVSLTVNHVVDEASGSDFSVNLIPHTLTATTLQHLTPGTHVNLEVDLIARYCEKIFRASSTGSAKVQSTV